MIVPVRLRRKNLLLSGEQPLGRPEHREGVDEVVLGDAAPSQLRPEGWKQILAEMGGEESLPFRLQIQFKR